MDKNNAGLVCMALMVISFYFGCGSIVGLAFAIFFGILGLAIVFSK